MPTLKLHFTGKRVLHATYSLASPAVRQWIVYLPESGADFQLARRSDLREILGARIANQFNYLVINKTGLSPKRKNPDQFERSFRRQLRIKDAVAAMDEIIPQDHSLIIVGYSEGGYLAPQVALLDPRTKGVVMIGGGTRGWLKEELSNAGPMERGALSRRIREIYRHPHSKKLWNGFSYATWYSYREDSTFKALQKLKVPALAVIGGRDRTIDFKSALRDFKALARDGDLKLKVLTNCGHSFVNHWTDAWFEVRKFLARLKL